MEKYEPKNYCFPQIQLSRYNINSSPNNNYIFEQNKVNNFYHVGYQDFSNIKYNVNENLNIILGITFNELESLTKENLIQLIQFINYSCNLYLKDIKFSNCCCSIFGIKENLNRNGYNIVISKNEINELHSKFRSKSKDINENNIILENNEKFYNKIINESESNFYLLNEINEEKHNYCLPISCPIHNNIKFKSLTSYLNHCKESHKIFSCKDCGKLFEDFNNFKLHIYKILNIEDENINNNIKDNDDAPPLFENLMEPKKLENNIRCSKCDLIFDSVEKMSFHFYEQHEKKIEETSKINEEFEQNENQSINENAKEFSVNRIEDNENEEKIENLNKNEEKNKKNEEAVKKLSFERGEELEIIKEMSRENSSKKNCKYLQRKRNYEKEEREDEIFLKKGEFNIQDDLKRKEELKGQEELKRQDELKKQNELKKKEEPKKQEELKNKEDLKRQEELKNQENLEIQEKLIKQEDLKEEKEICNDGFYFECFYDKERFSTQNLFLKHFRKEHPVFCCMCGKKFSSKIKLQNHYSFRIKKHNIIKCKLCSKSFLTVNSLIMHCENKNH